MSSVESFTPASEALSIAQDSMGYSQNTIFISQQKLTVC